MSDTRKVLVVTDNRTIIKKIKVGTPIANVTSAGISTSSIVDLDTTNPSAGDILVYQPSSGNYYTAALTGGTNLEVVYDSSTRDVLTVNTTLGSLSGSIIPDSNEVYDLGSSSKKFRDLYLSGSTINLGTLQLQDSGGSFIVKDSSGNPVLTEVSLVSSNTNILSYDSATGLFTFNDSDVARTDIDETFHRSLTVADTLEFAALGNSATYAVRGILSAGTGLTYDSGQGQFDISDTSVSAGTYGSSTQVPQLTINAQGQIDSAGLITIAGVTGVDFDSATGTLTIQTTGGNFSDVITLDPYTTSNLIEGSNLYYTTARADSAFDIRLATKTTTNLTEGDNLYYTTARADSAFDIRLATKTTTDLNEGNNLYYTTVRADSDARHAITLTDNGGDGSLTYDVDTGNITYVGPSAVEVRAHFQSGVGVTFDSASGTISIGQPVGTGDNVVFNDMVVSGNLTVSGSTTTVNTETINLADNEIVLNSNFDSGAPTENGGISIRRGDADNKTLLWNETDDKWTVGSETFVAATFEGNLTGNVTGQVSDISNHSTSDLSEGSNLYYTTARADSAFDVRLATKSTSNLTEGNNLYYTTARADSAFDVRLATKTTDDVTEGNNLYYTTARADSDAKNSISVTDAGGDGSLTYSASTGVITYTGPSASEVRAHLVEGIGLTYDSATGVFSITDTGVVAGTYGSDTAIPVITVNAQGQIDSVGTIGVSGITGVDFDSATGTLTINTSTGNFTDVITLDPYTTSNLTESGNLYYTTARVDSAFDVRLATKSTTDVSEGTNLYYTTARADSAFDVRLAIKTTTNLAEGDNLYYTSTRADSDFDIRFTTKTTDNLTEGAGNQYFTTARARNSMVAGTGITYDSSTGVIASAYQAVDTTDSVTFSGLYVSGNTVLGGNLTVTGTTTTVNTEEINLADNTIRLNSNHTGSATQSAGIEIERGTDSNTSLLWDEAADRWSIGTNNFAAGTFIGNLTGQASDISNHTTDDLTQGSTNLYYDSATTETTARYSLSVTDAGGDGSLTYNTGTGVFTYTGPSASEVRAHINVSGDLAYDSATGQLSFTERTDQEVRNIFSVSGDLAYDSSTGQFTFTERTDQEVRNLFSASGDLSYDSATGQFSFDVEQVYTKANFDSDFDIRIGEKTTDNLAEGSTNKYYDSATTETTARYAISVNDAGGDGSLSYNTGTGVITYTGPSATEVRSHLSVSGDLAYDSSTGQFSFTERTDAEVRNLMVAGTGITYDSATGVISSAYQAVSTTSDVTFAKVTQDSAVANSIQLNRLQGRPNNTAGTLFFDSDHQKALSVNMSTRENANPDVTLNIGQEIFVYVHNLTGEQINNGDAVYISGTAHNKHPQVSKAQADVSATGNPTGLATMDIPNGGHGWVTRYGIVRDINTGGLTPGGTLYLSADSAGKWTQTEVTVDTGYPFHIGRVLTADSTAGTILVDGFSEHFEYLRIEDRLKIDGKLEADSASLLNVQFNTTLFDSHQPYSEGLLFYDNAHKTLNYFDDINQPHEIGLQEHQRVFNNTGSLIRKGQPLYFSGNYTSGIIDVPTVGLADATDVSAYNAQGIAAADIPDNSYGHCLISGQLTEVNTAGLSDGDNFFVGLGPGLVQNASPVYPNFPMCLGWVVLSGDSSTGVLLVNQQNHSVNSFRVQTSAHVGNDLIVDGDLVVNGTQTITSTENVQIGGNIQYLNAGDTIGEAGTTFVGSGLDDAFFSGHYSGDSSTKNFYVKIDSAGATDTFEWGFDSAVGAIATGVTITGLAQSLTAGIEIDFGATTGHTLGDVWAGTATAVDVDTGFFSNRNTGDAGEGYTHVGLFFDASTSRWRLLSKYDSEPEAPIDITSPSLEYGTLVAGLEGNVTGDVTGNASTATALATGRDFSLTGDITATAINFDGTGNVALSTSIAAGAIVNADINATANIADTKLATISTAGKVQNSATTATNVNTGSTIVARDASGDFNAGVVRLTDLFVGNLHVDSADIISLARGSLSGGTGITYNAGTGAISTTDGDIVHDNLSGFVANEHIDHTTVSITAGAGLSGGGTIAATRTIDIGAGAGITVNANNLQIDSSYTRGLFSASGDLSYNSGTGEFSFTERTNQEVRNLFSTSGDLAYDSATGQFSFSETYSTANELLTAIKTVDGGSSGLDADLLDGQEGTHYRINVYDNSGTLLN